MKSGPLPTFGHKLPLFALIFACLALVPARAWGQTAAPLAVNCTPASGPTMVGQFYVASCNGSGGVPPYTWALATFISCGNMCNYYGQLPPGISFSSSGSTAQISGTPTTPGPYLYGAQLTD